MSKKYIKPISTAIDFALENSILVKDSYEVSSDGETNEVLSNERGWGHNLWETDEEEEK